MTMAIARKTLLENIFVLLRNKKTKTIYGF